MRISAAFVGIILIWSTTPLAIKLSGEGPGYLFGASARMSIGLLAVGLILLVTRTPLKLDRPALLSYVAGAVQIFGSMLVTYWSAQHIPSGWVSVVFGLTPLMTAIIAALWLGEKSLGLLQLLSYGLGFAGLALMFHSALSFSPKAVLGIAGVLVAAFLQAFSSVWVKRINASQPAIALVGGGLLLSVPVYWLMWLGTGGVWPTALPEASLWSIVYLGGFATPFGFTLYYYLLRNMPATRVALITLLTPVLSLYLGHVANHEPVHGSMIGGTALIMLGLLLHSRSPAPPPDGTGGRVRRARSRNRNFRGSAP